jgi:hypothetical protein
MPAVHPSARCSPWERPGPALRGGPSLRIYPVRSPLGSHRVLPDCRSDRSPGSDPIGECRPRPGAAVRTPIQLSSPVTARPFPWATPRRAESRVLPTADAGSRGEPVCKTRRASSPIPCMHSSPTPTPSLRGQGECVQWSVLWSVLCKCPSTASPTSWHGIAHLLAFHRPHGRFHRPPLPGGKLRIAGMRSPAGVAPALPWGF